MDGSLGELVKELFVDLFNLPERPIYIRMENDSALFALVVVLRFGESKLMISFPHPDVPSGSYKWLCDWRVKVNRKTNGSLKYRFYNMGINNKCFIGLKAVQKFIEKK